MENKYYCSNGKEAGLKQKGKEKSSETHASKRFIKRLYGSGDTNLFKGKGNLVKIGIGISRIQQHLCGEDEKIKKNLTIHFEANQGPKKHLILDYANKWPSINRMQHGQEHSSSKT
jgi:hypothetical protein